MISQENYSETSTCTGVLNIFHFSSDESDNCPQYYEHRSRGKVNTFIAALNCKDFVLLYCRYMSQKITTRLKVINNEERQSTFSTFSFPTALLKEFNYLKLLIMVWSAPKTILVALIRLHSIFGSERRRKLCRLQRNLDLI